MKKSRYSQSQIVKTLKEAEGRRLVKGSNELVFPAGYGTKINNGPICDLKELILSRS